jgi:hypothetical protein
MQDNQSNAVLTPPAAGGYLPPPNVQLILTALNSASHPRLERRSRRRVPYYSEAELRLFSDPCDSLPRLLYTRDVCTRGLGFITADYLPLGHGGKLALTVPDGRRLLVHCTLSRCRQISPGWYEGGLQFIREQMDFAELV